MKNPIAQRIFDYTMQFPPFNLMEAQKLLDLCQTAEVMHLAAGQFLFKSGEAPHSRVYLVRDGALNLYADEAGGLVLLETHDEGDVVGLRPLISGDDYGATVQAEEESILYSFDIQHFEGIMQQNPDVSNYLLRTFAALARGRFDTSRKAKMFVGKMRGMAPGSYLSEIQSVRPNREPVTCAPHDSIQFATQLMTERKVGSMLIVDEEKRPVGIFTDRDLRQRIASGQFDSALPVSSIMVSPVITASPEKTVADVQILMVQHKIHHLCITADGTPNSSVVGVLSDHDLLVTQANNPATLIREMKRAKDGSRLAEIRERGEILLEKYIHQEVNILFISTIMSEINDALIVRANQLAEESLAERGMSKPPSGFCWLGLGSEGRSEQLLRTDQDNALIFENVDGSDIENTRNYFVEYAKIVTGILNEAGFEYCPGDMMASNPKWCLSLEEWKANFAHWINLGTNEALLNANIFFDYRPIYGKFDLAAALTQSIFEELNGKDLFFARLAANAQENPPPLSFFRNFVVERGGEHKDRFDIKARAMMPLADAARVLILEHRISGVGNTVRRFQLLAEHEPQNADLFEQAADAYEVFMRYRALQGLRDNSSGRYFNPEELNKLERMNLRNSFKPIDDLQTLLKVRFKTAFF